MHRSALTAIFCQVVIFGGMAAAQSTTPADHGPIIRTTVSEVALDLIVRDKHGKSVTNLKAGDVAIYEDGVRQPIRSFRVVTGIREPAPTTTGGVTATGTAPAKATGARPLRAINVVCIVFHNLDPVSRTRALSTVEEFLQYDVPPDTWIGVFDLGDRLTGVQEFTQDRKEVLQAARNGFAGRNIDFAQAASPVLSAEPNMMTTAVAVDMAGRSATVDVRVTGGEINRAAINGADVATSEGANRMRGEQADQMRQFGTLQGMRETDQIINLIKQLGPLPGRKTVLLLTPGLRTTGDSERFDSILSSAHRVGVTFYAVDAHGLNESSTALGASTQLAHAAAVSRTQQAATGSGAGQVGMSAERSRQNDYTYDAVRNSDLQASLRALSEGTGGFLIANTNDFKKPFTHLIGDMDAHYEVVYQPAPRPLDGRFRKIEIKLARPDEQAESRPGYFAMPEIAGSTALLPFEIIGLAVLNNRPLPHAFDFLAGAFWFQNDGLDSHGALVFELPGASLVATPNPGRQTHTVHASLLALVSDATGQVVDKFDVDAPYEIPDSKLQAVRSTPQTYTHPLKLPPGRYKVETVVMDREGNRSSTSAMGFDSPVPDKSVGLSSPMLIQRMEPAAGSPDPSDPLFLSGQRLVPQLATTLAAEAKPYVYFVVYPDKSNVEKPRVRVEFLVDGQVVADQTSALPAPNAAGAIPMIIRAATHAGNCELKITALQGSESAARNVVYTVEGK